MNFSDNFLTICKHKEERGPKVLCCNERGKCSWLVALCSTDSTYLLFVPDLRQSVTSRLETSRYQDFSQFFESIGLSLENFGLEKKSRYRSRKYLVSKKSLGISLENIWSRKKVSVSVSKTLVSKKVSVSVSKILVSKKVSVTT